MEKQLDKSYIMQMEYDDNLLPKYIMGEAMSIAETYDAGKIQALELAKQNLVGQIQTEVTALIESTVENKQLGAEDGASVVQTISTGKALISQSVGRTITVIELYRTLPSNRNEVMVRRHTAATWQKRQQSKPSVLSLKRKVMNFQKNLTSCWIGKV